MARLYADENFPFPVVEALRHYGHDVLTLQEAGYGGQAIPDETVLEQAFRDHRRLEGEIRVRRILHTLSRISTDNAV